MKKIRFILPIILLVCILCGCSSDAKSTQAPYLDLSEREKIESTILESLEFFEEEYFVTAHFSNNTKYMLRDVQFVLSENNLIACSIPCLEKNASGKLRVYSDEVKADGCKVYLIYTIGEYRYTSELTVPVRKTLAEEKEIPDIHISVKTKDGLMELDFSKPLEFFSGTEVSGLQKTRIYSIQPEIPYDGAVDIRVTGSKPDNFYKTVVAKLWDENGIIVDTSSLYFSQEENTLYFFDVEPGNYTLTFEEKK